MDGDDDYDHRLVWIFTLAITGLCAGLTAALVSVMPRPNQIPFALHVWMAFGWVTGWYLSLSFLVLRPIFGFFASDRAMKCIDAAHGLQLPIVVVGVGTWAVVKALGLI
jgi:hypothetical protein